MNILIVTQYFWPENFRINDFALEFRKKGHSITVLTAIPNYPDGQFYDGYGIFKRRREIVNGIKIFRSVIIPRGNGSGVCLFLNYFSYIIFSLYEVILLSKLRFDLIFVYEPSPITVVIPAIILKKIKKIPICLWVLDLWPESILSSKKVKTKLIPTLIMPLIKLIYKNSDKILVSSKGFIKSITDKGIPPIKLTYFTQWAESIFKPSVLADVENRSLIPKGFIIMFAGNIGAGQDFGSILRAAEIIKDYSNIHWLIIGGGSEHKFLKDEILKRGLTKTFHLLGQFPIEKMPAFYVQADVMLITLSRKEIYSLTVPGKLQSYLACGKPVLSMVDGETSTIIKEAGAGLTCSAENPECLAENVLQLYNMKKDDLLIMGNNARQYYEKFFDRSMLLDRIEKIFSQVSGIH